MHRSAANPTIREGRGINRTFPRSIHPRYNPAMAATSCVAAAVTGDHSDPLSGSRRKTRDFWTLSEQGPPLLRTWAEEDAAEPAVKFVNTRIVVNIASRTNPCLYAGRKFSNTHKRKLCSKLALPYFEKRVRKTIEQCHAGQRSDYIDMSASVSSVPPPFCMT